MANIEEKILLLQKMAKKLNDANVTWALGGSMLLYFKGIAPEFHDIDIMIEETDVDVVKNILSDMGKIQPANPNSKYKTKSFMEFIIESIDIDVMAGFSILDNGKVYDCSLKSDQIEEYLILNDVEISLQSVSRWLTYYKLMGRKDKVQMIETCELKKQ